MPKSRPGPDPAALVERVRDGQAGGSKCEPGRGLDLAGRRVILPLLLRDAISRLGPEVSWATCADGPNTRHVLLLDPFGLWNR